MLRFAWIALAVCLGSAGCEKKAQTDFPPSGAVFTFRVDASKPEGTSSMVEAVQRRLEARGFANALAVAKGPDHIRVTVPGIGEEGVGLIKNLLTRPTRVAFSQAEDGQQFFQGLKDKLPGDGSIKVGSDTYNRGVGGPAAEAFFLQAADQSKLKAFLATLTPPTGQKLWILPGKNQALAYLIQDPPAMSKPVVTEANVILDEQTTEPQVGITFDEESKEAFAELTKKSLHRRLAILVDDKISSLPVVQSPIEGGRARISPSPVNQGPATQKEALALAAGIKAWSLASGLTLVEHQVVKPPAK